MESSIAELAKYRYETSIEAIEDAKIMFENGRYKNALNRAYYSIFHAIRAVNTFDGFDSSKHSGVIAHFNQAYVKTELISKEASKIIKLASENREKADYLDFFVASRVEAQNQIERAVIFCEMIRIFLLEKGYFTDLPQVHSFTDSFHKVVLDASGQLEEQEKMEKLKGKAEKGKLMLDE